MKRTVKRIAIGGVPLFPGFVPLRALWEGPDAPFPSEYSARWNFRRLKPELVKADAVIARGHAYLIHAARFAAVAEQDALRSFQERVQSGVGHDQA